jgi:hypothetical protein
MVAFMVMFLFLLCLGADKAAGSFIDTTVAGEADSGTLAAPHILPV